MPAFLRNHIDEGGMAVVREPGEDGGRIVLYQDMRRDIIMKAADIPATLHGMATFNVANALAVIAMCLAHEVPILTIRTALMTFQSTFEQNPGRLNVHDAHGFRVILDYAHNAAGLSAMGELVKGLRHRYKRMMCCISIPGDRRDEDILEMGRIAAGVFDTLFFREDPSTRGRKRGEIMNLLKEGAIQGGASEDRIHLIAGEEQATAAALTACRPGDLLVITPTDVFGAWAQVNEFRPAELDPSDTRTSLVAAE
jgi:cyanophycin synthetase